MVFYSSLIKLGARYNTLFSMCKNSIKIPIASDKIIKQLNILEKAKLLTREKINYRWVVTFTDKGECFRTVCYGLYNFMIPNHKDNYLDINIIIKFLSVYNFDITVRENVKILRKSYKTLLRSLKLMTQYKLIRRINYHNTLSVLTDDGVYIRDLSLLLLKLLKSK